MTQMYFTGSIGEHQMRKLEDHFRDSKRPTYLIENFKQKAQRAMMFSGSCGNYIEVPAELVLYLIENLEKTYD